MAIIKRIKDATRCLGAPVDWEKQTELPVNSLPIRDVVYEGVPFMISAWELSTAEIEALKNGETLKLWIQGSSHPVVCLSVGEL